MRDITKVKAEFLRICNDFGISRVYVNFENPFSVQHAEQGEEFYVLADDENTKGTLKLEFLFAPDLKSEDEDVVMSVRLAGYTIRKKGITLEDVEARQDLRLLYSKEEGIQFG